MNGLLLDTFDSRWRDLRAARKACRKHFSPEAVHDLRVASRRLLALAELLRTAAPDAPVKRLRKALKAQLRAFDALRDTQVMRQALAGSVAAHPALKPVLRRLARHERSLRAGAEKQIRSESARPRMRRVTDVRQALAEMQRAPAVVRKAADRAFGHVLARDALLPPFQPAAIHRLRVAFKKFRYLAEVAAPALRAFPESLPSRRHAFQAAMGEVQDAEVLRAYLAGAGCPKSVIRFAERRLASAIAAFAELRPCIATFWRASTRAAFPWEARHEPVPHPPRNRRRAGRQA